MERGVMGKERFKEKKEFSYFRGVTELLTELNLSLILMLRK